MSGLALVAHARGARVSGSDRAESGYIERLRAAGLEPRIGHDADAVPDDAEVVVSSAIGEDNPELVRARERGQRVMHRGELLAELCEGKRQLIASPALTARRRAPGCSRTRCARRARTPRSSSAASCPGAGAGGQPANAGWGEGEWVVAEADESDGSFLALRPEVAIVTNVELDHHARWHSRGELLDAFAEFLGPVAGVALGADEGLDGLAAGERRVVRFDAGRPGPRELELAVPGRHNLANARGTIAAAELCGLRRRCLRGRAGDVSRDGAAPRAQGEPPERRRGLRRLRPPPNRGQRGAGRAA